MNKIAKYTITALCVVLFCLATAAVASLSGDAYDKLTCSGIDISFTDSLRFVDEDDVKEHLSGKYGTYIGQRLDSVDLARIEKVMDARSPIRRCEAWTTSDGMLHLSISQREPVVRFQKGQQGFYCDAEGYLFPLHSSFSADVPLIEGEIPVEIPQGYRGVAPTSEERSWVNGVLQMAKIVNGTKPWKGSVTRIVIGEGGDILLSLNKGEELFNIGGPEDLDVKFSKIEKYYSYIAPNLEEGQSYSTVNVKYNNQIICRKKDI